MEIKEVHANWPENKGFILEINKCESYYVFIHFHTEVELITGEVIKPGGCVLYKPHSYRYFKAEKCILYHDWMNIEGNFAKLIKKYNIECNRVYYPLNTCKITDIILDIESEKQLNSKYCKDIYNFKIQELFIKMSQELHENHKIRIDTNIYKRLLSVHKAIRMYYKEIHNVEKFAKEIALSESQFYTLYNKAFGISPKQDLINTRIEHSKCFLKCQYSVSETAELVGYTNLYHFSRQFKKYVGLTPSQYKENIKK